MGYCQLTQTWMPNIGKPYVVRLESRQVKCCSEERELFINDTKVEAFDMRQAICSCSPLCGPNVSYAWEEHGHRFLLQFNSLVCCSNQYYRLFVDGVDVNTGLGYSAYFRRQGHIRWVAALIFFLLLGGGIALVVLLRNGLGQLWIPINAGYWFLFFLVTGTIAVVKFKNKSEVENQAAPTSWPEAYRSTTVDKNTQVV